MKDFRGKPLAIGDRVITTSLHYKGLVVAEVVGFTPKMVRIKLVTSSNYIDKAGQIMLREPYTLSVLND
jgi:hypothetical protein